MQQEPVDTPPVLPPNSFPPEGGGNEHRTREGAARRRTVEDAPLIGVLHWTLSGGVTDANDVFLSMLGYDRDDLAAGRIDWFALTPEEWRAADADGMVQVRAAGRHEPFRKEFFRRDGTRVPVLLGSALYPDSRTEGVSFVLDLARLDALDREAVEGAIQRRIAGVLEGIGDAFLVLDPEWRIAYMNAEAERLSGRHRNELIGRSHWEVWPASVGTEVERQYRRVAQERVVAHFENLYDDGTARVWFKVRAYPADGGGVNVFYRDITAERRRQVALETSADALRASEERLASVIGTAMDGILIAGEDQRIVSANPAALGMFGYAEEAEVVGAPLEVLMPERFRAAHGGHVQRFGGSGLTRRTRESFGVLTARRKDGGEFPIEASVSRFTDREGRTLFAAFVRDISERLRAETALRESEQRFRALVDASSQIVWTNSPEGRMEGEQAGWAAFTGQTFEEYQGFGWALAVHPDDRQPTVNEWDRCVRERAPFLWEHRVRRSDGAYRTFAIRAVPVLNDDGGIREWVGIHTDITERRADEMALREALERERAHAARESVLARIGAAVRSSLPPAEVQAVAVEALGRALRVDRCYFSTVDVERDQTVIGRDFHTEGVPPFAGSYRLSDFDVDVARVFVGGRTVAVADTQDIAAARAAGLPWSERTAATLAGMRVRALVNVPFLDAGGRVVAALGAAMADAPRSWTPEEVAFVERVATETREAMDVIRRQQRERNIAEQLQEVLTPPTPPQLPGLSLASYYRPALAEAGVGGDFFDVFSVEEGCTALVVADLSGKGLAAAQQVATVRNMLRFALYDGRSVSEATSHLHKSLVDHNLLTGFATLFVGLYDHAERTVTYVNCGQEPGLIWRAATGGVEQLGPTGPVLGGFGEGAFEQETVRLHSGDVVALFTDGLTEVGPSRKELLEVEGVGDLLRACCSDDAIRADMADAADPRVLVDRLIASVDAFARGGLRDDIALLVGVAAGSAP